MDMSAKVESKKGRSAEERKAELIAGLRDVRERILVWVSSLPERKRAEIFLGTWSSRELLAHLAGWDETNLRAAKEILAGELPSFYEHYDKDWATYNARLVAEYRGHDDTDLLDLVRLTHENLLKFIEDLPASELWKDRGIRAKGWKVTIGRLLEVERKDEEEHLLQLKRFTGKGIQT